MGTHSQIWPSIISTSHLTFALFRFGGEGIFLQKCSDFIRSYPIFRSSDVLIFRMLYSFYAKKLVPMSRLRFHLKRALKKRLILKLKQHKFLSHHPQWRHTKHEEEEIARYLEATATSKVSPNFIHGTYLVNLGTDSPEHLKKSIDWLIYAQKMAGRLGIQGTIFHPGSHKGRGFEEALPQIVDSLKQVLAETPENVWLILETSAGAGGVLGGIFMN